MTDQIIIRGARLHNLKNITLSIPKNQLVVLTGLSGSGKSTLGFDILHKEGQRQYLESLGLVSYDLAKPPVDSISGLSPSISVDQHLTNRSPRSTVGTVTEVYTYLRVLYARLGHRPCPACGKDVAPLFDPCNSGWESETGTDEEEAAPEDTFPCPHCGAPIPELGMASFSFNKPAGACPTCTGLGVVHQADTRRLVDEGKSIPEGAVTGWDVHYINHYTSTLQAAAAYYGFDFNLSVPVKDYAPPQRDLLFFGVHDPRFRRHFPGIEPPTTVRQGRFEGVATNLLRRYADRIHDAGYREKLDEYLVTQTCPDCAGTRLRQESRVVTVDERTIIEISRLPLTGLADWLDRLPSILSQDEKIVAGLVLEDLSDRITRLVEVGAGYLTLDRSTPTLSAGEAQRLRLASLLGSGLSGVLYVFDEPTIGTHPRDNRRLIGVLRRLRDLGNTVLVIEHDLEMISAADYVIDFGPGAGVHGGQVMASSAPEEVAGQPGSLTGQYLSGSASIPLPQRRRIPSEKVITIHGARQHNLQDLTVRLPLGLLVVVTGVSGSGKSSLVFSILDRAIRQRLYRSGETPGEHDSIEGYEYIDKVITIDQEHIGRIPRSNAATYSDTFTPIREAFAATSEARRLGLSARHFSFNVPGGRCERCKGAGTLTVQMHFLPDVEVRCPACHGRRFTRQTLAVRYQEHDISQVLDLTIEEALALFQDVPAAHSRLQVLSDVGLGYLQLGQPATTLSGGEAQRIKLARELGRRAAGHTLYLLDEPTTGLHLADTAYLLGVLQHLVEAGNTVMIVEHNLEKMQRVLDRHSPDLAFIRGFFLPTTRDRRSIPVWRIIGMNSPAYVIIGQYHRRKLVPLPMHRRFLFLVLPLLLFLPLLSGASPSLAQAGSAYDLIASVNQLRSTNGLGALSADGALMAAAQVQSDYQAAIGSFTHTGEGGSTPRDRAVAAGYGGSGVTENIAGGMDLSPGGAISIWSRDALHTNTMLGNYTDIGGGVATSGGVVYYTLLVGNRGGAASVPPAQAPTTAPPAGATAVPPIQLPSPIQTSTPGADGSVFHVVQPGDNPVSIAQAYGIDLGTFLAQNDLIQNPLIYPGDVLVIRLAPTATATLDATPTRIPTRTPRPTREPTSTPTDLPPTRTPTEALPTLSPTPTPPDPLSAAGLASDPLVWAIGVLALAGLLLIVVGSVLKRGS